MTTPGGTAPVETGRAGQAAIERLIAQVAALDQRALSGPHPAVSHALTQLGRAWCPRATSAPGCAHAPPAGRRDRGGRRPPGGALISSRSPARSPAAGWRGHAQPRAGSRECRALVEALATGQRPESGPHVVVGQIEIVSLAARRQPVGIGGRGSRGMSEHHVELARDLFARIRHEGDDARSRRGAGLGPRGCGRSVDPGRSADGAPEVARRVHLRPLGQRLAPGPGPGPRLRVRGPLLHAIGVGPCCTTSAELRVPLDVLNKDGQALRGRVDDHGQPAMRSSAPGSSAPWPTARPSRFWSPSSITSGTTASPTTRPSASGARPRWRASSRRSPTSTTRSARSGPTAAR